MDVYPTNTNRFFLSLKVGTMSNHAYMIANVTFNKGNMGHAKEYMDNSLPLLLNNGAEIVSRLKLSGEVIFGKKTMDGYLIAKFPNKDAIKSVFQSENYKKLTPVRDKGFTEFNVFIAETL